MRTLRQCLFDCDLALLRAIATQWGIDLPTNRHDDAVDTLAAHLASPSAQAEMWSALPEAERLALLDVLNASGEMPGGAFTRRFGEIRPMGPGRLERERPWESPVSVAEGLWYRGLIFKAFDQGPGAMQEVVFVPQELQAGLGATESANRDTAPTAESMAHLSSVAQTGQTRSAGAQSADDACSFLIYVHSTSVHIAPGQPLPAHHLRALSYPLLDRDPIRLDLLMHLAAQLSLVKPTNPLRPDPQAATAWLQSSTLEQQHTLYEGWRESTAWNDLWRVPSLRCEDTGSWHNDPLSARHTALDWLAKLDPGAWYRLEDFVTAIHETSPDFQRPGGDYDTWYIRDAATNQYLTGFESWDQVEGALLSFIVRGPLHWLGVIDLGETSPTFRVTPMGRWLLGLGDEPPSSQDAPFAVRANGRVEIGAARRYDRFQLARVADWVSSGAVYSYQLKPSSLERARTQHIGTDRILEFLEHTSRAPVPDTLAGALHRWGTRGTEAWVQPAMALRVAQPELLDQLLDSPRTRKYIREAVSSTVALVHPRDWPEMAAVLLEMGILPEVKVEPGVD
jgi:hypothetical protein